MIKKSHGENLQIHKENKKGAKIVDEIPTIQSDASSNFQA